ncbi:ribonuclease S-6-like [Pyrus x bretschneideri]|uniref:S39-RNase n=1 Tax=Pyrus x bretschneideri TaxID=225117 RepID=A0FH58_9ROSA|nr:ribonuclease S-6-like [Pyrus x bretschneideri]ABJ97134.1 S39-RNase [Pyrus x bretschneideri]ABY55861.1 S39-RNase [Pyrus x bretschneideri]
MGITGMIYTVTIVFSLIVLILSSSTVGFDYFQFTQQYQPAACNSRPTPCKDPPDKLFTVHGLWPSNWSGHDPEYCKKTALDSKKIGNRRAKLDIIWPNVFDRTDNVGFWGRQWEKHGICGSPTIQDDMNYLETVIKMYITDKQNVSEILSKAKMEPEGIKRKRWDIVMAIRNGTKGKRPKLKCQKNNRMTELVEVTLCSDKNITQLINCPNLIQPPSPFFCPNKGILY